jgi:ethanolamine permease
MAALFKLRAARPDLPRPFRVPLYPVVPAVALLLAVVCLGATLAFGKWQVAAAYAGLLALAGVYYFAVVPEEVRLGAEV